MTRLMGLLLVLLFSAGPVVAATGPSGQLRDSLEAVIDMLKDKTLATAQRRQRIADVIHQRFDFHAMSRRALSTNWKKASPA